ncbi:hypothetical protein HU200_040837 [Digitaria exilis]|uniref:O-methyltransferase domain-containing protein n=1 Tax=Digitaria exilis TaxID=1010633 RepID=A0A835B7U1_9POAL|nr:hypothetical protein HU200_040837 [Digitaria exilis]
MALRCAIKLRIPTTIHRCGGAASLSELQAALPSIATSKRPCLSRIMTFLAASGIFAVETPANASRLLVDDDEGRSSSDHSSSACLSKLMLLFTMPLHFMASQSLPEWFQREEEEDDATSSAAAETSTPFSMAHGESLYGMVGRDAEFSACFHEAMGSDSRFTAEILVRECGGVAFPHVRCSVLELPHVVDVAAPAVVDSRVEFVAGDMMEFIPPADAVLLKFVLHNWSDEDCVRILKRSKESISTREPKGKVIVIDVVLGMSPSKQILEAQLSLDLCMMVLFPGKQRTEDDWHKIFLEAGFTRYKISPVLGSRSLIEVYP